MFNTLQYELVYILFLKVEALFLKTLQILTLFILTTFIYTEIANVPPFKSPLCDKIVLPSLENRIFIHLKNKQAKSNIFP